jgi:hypothetical protein
VTTAQVEFTPAELLASHEYEEPLVASGVRCHGGFDAGGSYVSPRTKQRVPAIAAWEEQRREQFGTDPLAVPLDAWPAHYPSVDQARFLIRHGVREPIVATLTRIGTVEGFGGMIRHAPVPDLRRCLEEDVRGTAAAHLTRGLYEAHARDEAGFEDEGGHRQMWFAARDIAFEHPPTEDETELMLQRMGLARGPGGRAGPAQVPARLLPGDVDPDLEPLIERMARLLLIEISAFHTFAWAEEVLADPDLVAGDGEAATLVSYIRSDEAPHVAYLTTVLSELRDRTFLGSGGRRYPGTDLVGRIWDRAVADSLGPRQLELRRVVRSEVAHAVDGRPDGADLLAEFDAAGLAAA